MDNGINTVKKIYSNPMDSDFVEQPSLCETLIKTANADNEYYSGSSETDLQIAEHKNNSKSRSLRKIIDSESEEDAQTSESYNFLQRVHHITCTTAKNYRALIDSESEEETQNEETEFEKDAHTSESNNLPQTALIGENQISVDSEPKEEKQYEKTKNDTHIIFNKAFENKDVKKKSLKKRRGSIRASKDEAMRQIHSESQRLLRETEISLPYHRPKQRTLQEFLNRKRVSAALPKAPSTAAKLKMSSVIVSQVLAEKEKEAELFYKSSDSEDDVQSMPLVSKNIKKSSIRNEREMSSICIEHTHIQNPKRFETSNRHSQVIRKEIVQKNHLDANACEMLLQNDFCEVDHRGVELASSIDNNCNPDGFDTLLPQIINEYNQNFPKISSPRKLIDIHFENDSCETYLDEQEIIKETAKTIISLNKEKCINDDEKLKITVTENQISKVYQDDSNVINRRDKNSVTEATKIGTTSNSINSKEVTEIFQSDNDTTDNIMCSNFNECTTEDMNNEKKDQYFKINSVSSSPFLVINDIQSKIQHNSSADECEKIDNHLQVLSKSTDETFTNRKKLSTLVSNSKVTLRGSPGMIIDLRDDVKSKKQSDNKSEITAHLQNKNSLLPINEALPYKTSVNIDNSELNKPGAKLMRLKEDLKLQMILKRNKVWKLKEIKLQTQEEEWNREEKSDYDLDEQEQAELDFELSDSEESEFEENDVCIRDKKRSKCLFADDEAEVTDNEDSSIEETCDKNEDHIKYGKQSTNFKYRKEYMDDDVSEIETDDDNEEDDDDNDDDDNEDKYEGKENEESLEYEESFANMKNGNESDLKDVDNVNACESFNITKNDRKTKLIEQFQNDSNVTNPSYLQNHSSQLNMPTDINASKTHCDDIDWISENESNMPACQQEVTTRSQICKTPLTKTSMLDLVSPITQLSVLNTTLENEKDSQKREYLVDKYEFLSMKNTQNDELSVCKNKSIFKKKLFDDIGETVDDEYLMRLCSGKFESPQRTDIDLFSQSSTTELQLHSNDSECRNSNAKLVAVKSKNSKDKMLQNIKLTLDEDSNNSVNHVDKINKVSAMDSELKLRVMSSDDEDEDTFLKPKKRFAKVLNLSDSEEGNSQFFNKDDINSEEKQYVDYDSEENEIIIVPEKDIKKVAASFVEEEAELSESDWDSADEDEKNLDNLEFEEADDEHIDEHEVKDQLEKIHIKQLLDEDKRDVRLLKELLFEDGDLHSDGMGRERKFKWKNIDKLGNNIEMSQISDENEGWVDVEDDEEEAKWSKLKNERDRFLEERMKCSNNEIEDELCHSKIFKLGLEAVKKIKGNESQKRDTSLDKVNSSENIEPIMPRNITDLLNGPSIGKKCQIYNVIKKRSLLTRGEESLARIASLAKQGDSVSHAVNIRRNFIFPHIDQDTNNTLKKETETIADLDLQIKVYNLII
ncbi:PREDICTED: claspin-like [Trachymyrmex septentrionalis]|uniref:claspin-like n=1 Tax=Trachymyrmex septentrionalis TaxID=34720 RepID=UPI00084F1D06|nr:PREDICTED: claspin-like [Trachymyrmex septentrionalis]